MKSILLSCVVLLSTLNVSTLLGQVDIDNKDSNWIQYSRIATKSERIYDHERYQGDLYLYDDWKTGLFTLSDQSTLSIDSVKFNLFRGKVEIFVNGQHLEIRNSQFDSFVFEDVSEEEPAVFKSKHYYFDNGERLPGIIKAVSVGDHSVLIAYHSELRRTSQENPLMLEKLKKDMVRVKKYRYVEKDGELFRIKSKKDLFKFFDNQKTVKEYVSKNKLSHKEEDDIAKILRFVASNG